ncbi:uncharacterized protein [Lolium perenne]|uniref:uncharacterized protein n=1 Tax=Lolium perenne TaxID=4522 RepID=UPI0021F5A6FD|nr:uncharacterized protein LOC127312729 [Lolium perenne]
MSHRKSRKTDALMKAISTCFGGQQARRRRPCSSQGRHQVVGAARRVARWARSHWPRNVAPPEASSEQPAGATDQRDWSGLPEDLLLAAMASTEVLDVLNSGDVCSSWRAACAQFCRLHLHAKPNPPPCLLHARAADGAAAIYSPSTGATFPCRGGGFAVAGSAHGWVFAVDDATANPFLFNPLTGARTALPPLATLERVKGTSLTADGTVVYDIDHWHPTCAATAAMGVEPVTARRARDWMFRRAAISAAGVVLLVHMPHGEASYARPGDERWTSLSSVLASFMACPIIGVVHNNNNGLFYLMCQGGTIFSVDLAGPVPAGRTISYLMRELRPSYKNSYYVVFRGEELLVVTRHLSLSRPRAGEKDVSTTDIVIEKITFELPALVRLPGVGDDYALFLGNNEPMCLPVKDYPMLRPNCAYLADDSEQHFPPITRQDAGIWDFSSGRMHKFGSQLQPWLDERPPIWITPSLY